MSKIEKLKLRRKLNALEASKTKLCALRDKIKDQLSDMEDIVDSMENAIEAFEDGRRRFDEGIEELSKYV